VLQLDWLPTGRLRSASFHLRLAVVVYLVGNDLFKLDLPC